MSAVTGVSRYTLRYYERALRTKVETHRQMLTGTGQDGDTDD